jgi:DNA-directed RNA polymerase subunit K/omega
MKKRIIIYKMSDVEYESDVDAKSDADSDYEDDEEDELVQQEEPVADDFVGDELLDVDQPTEKPLKKQPQSISYDEQDDEAVVNYFQKFNAELDRNYVHEFHPECLTHNYDEIAKMTVVVRDQHGLIIDDLHKTVPILTKYERTKVLGQRAKQIECGATPFVSVPPNVIDGYTIAELELKQKRIPFIIRRPMPNGYSEYWLLNDLENVAY